ncbi:MAG: alpha/beta hydrolase [Chloroherpetonaceae bacterium]|nr:alpha/beta hydrolase [Chloroherpetonaceae bacterium]
MSNIETKFITLSGYKHRYVEAGKGDALFLTHGFSSSLNIFEKVIPSFAQHYRVLALDLLGFGKSDKPIAVRYSLSFYAKLMIEFLEKTGAFSSRAVYAVGHSMGGKYLLALCVLYPDSLTKLVVSNTDGFLYVPPFVRAASLWGVRHLVRQLVSTPAFVRQTMRSVYYDPSHITEEHFQRNIEMVRSDEHFAAMMALNRDYRHLDLQRTGIRNRLRELRLPVLILWGEHDRFIPPKYAEIARREVPNSTLHIIPNCGHVPMVEQPKEFFEVVHKFLSNRAFR